MSVSQVKYFVSEYFAFKIRPFCDLADSYAHFSEPRLHIIECFHISLRSLTQWQ